MDCPQTNFCRNTLLRCARLSACLQDERYQKAEIERCRSDIVHFVNHWCWTYDPREEVKTIPFALFAKQEDYLRWLTDRESLQEPGLVEKSRDAGVTWLCCAYAIHGWIFRPGYAVGFGSRKLELVDTIGDLNSIFEKLRFLLAHLPGFLRPVGFNPKKHAMSCRLLNPQNGAAITGEGGDQIGRGGREAIYFVDEAAYIERPALVDRALSATTRVRIDVSTPNGPGNSFAQKRFSGRVKVWTFQWRDDPRKDDAWYARMKAQYDPVTIAQEVDIDYTASIEGITIPAQWVRAAVGLKLPMGEYHVAGLDIAELGKDESVLVVRSGPVVFSPIAWGQVNTTETAHRAREKAEAQEVRELYYDVDGVGVGVRGAWAAFEGKLPFAAVAVNAQGTPTETRWPNGKTSRELFRNRKAEMWWLVRSRFEKTYEFVEQGIAHPPEELISIPNDPELIAQLSQPLNFRTESGKIQIESKEALKKRGVKSPDRAEALVLSFHPSSVLPRGSWGWGK